MDRIYGISYIKYPARCKKQYLAEYEAGYQILLSYPLTGRKISQISGIRQENWSAIKFGICSLPYIQFIYRTIEQSHCV
mgnify:CR=1 FL=1